MTWHANSYLIWSFLSVTVKQEKVFDFLPLKDDLDLFHVQLISKLLCFLGSCFWPQFCQKNSAKEVHQIEIAEAICDPC